VHCPCPTLVGATDPADNKTSSLTISPTVAQHIHVCASHKKPRLLLKYIATVREQEKAAKVRQAGPMIIFCNKIKTLKFVHDFLKRQNVKVSCVVENLEWFFFVITALFSGLCNVGCRVLGFMLASFVRPYAQHYYRCLLPYVLPVSARTCSLLLLTCLIFYVSTYRRTHCTVNWPSTFARPSSATSKR
jgi:hypothetical protein